MWSSRDFDTKDDIDYKTNLGPKRQTDWNVHHKITGMMEPNF